MGKCRENTVRLRECDSIGVEPSPHIELFGPSKIARAGKRTATRIAPGEWSVAGRESLGDAYDSYTITHDGRYYRCSCHNHVGGGGRFSCTHILAVMLLEEESQAPRVRVIGGSSSPVVIGPSREVDSVPVVLGPVVGESPTVRVLAPDEDHGPEWLEVAPDPVVLPSTLHLAQIPAMCEPSPVSLHHSPDLEPQDDSSPVSGGLGTIRNPSSLPTLEERLDHLILPPHLSTLRPAQREQALAAARHFLAGKKVVICDLPVGFGKSLFAEVVRQLLDTRATYLCTTKSLQAQFIRDFGEVPAAKLLQGKANYPTVLESGRFDPVRSWSDRHLSCGDCDYPNGQPGPEHPTHDGNGEEITRFCSYCPSKWTCTYTRAKRAAAESPLAVLNTAYWLSINNLADGQWKDRGLTILDEADELESALMSFVEVEISARRLADWKIGLPEKKTVSATWITWLEEVVIPRVKTELESLHERIVDLQSRGEEVSIRDRRESESLTRLHDRLLTLGKEIESGHWVFTGYKSDRPSAIFKPVKVSGFAQEYLWKWDKRFLVMSGTIPGGGEHFAEDRMGLDPGEWAFLSSPSTFPVERRPVRYWPGGDMSAKKEKESRPGAGRRLLEIVRRHPGERGLIHSVSFERAGWIAEVLRAGGLGDRVITYTRGSEREEALAKLKRTPGGVLIGPSIDRGTDCKYDLARFNVMAKIPYPYLGDEQVSARFHSPGGSLWYALETVGTIEQIFGRAMRAEDDWFQGYITDSGWQTFYSKHKHLFKAAFRDAIRTDDQDVLVRSGIRVVQADKPPPDRLEFTSADPWEDFPDPWERERIGSIVPGRKRL